MSAFNTLVDGDAYLGSPDPGPPPADTNAGATMGASMGPSLAPEHVAAVQGTPPLTGSHNTPLHVAFLGLVALGVVILLRLLGFAGFGVSGGVKFGR